MHFFCRNELGRSPRHGAGVVGPLLLGQDEVGPVARSGDHVQGRARQKGHVLAGRVRAGVDDTARGRQLDGAIGALTSARGPPTTACR